MKLYDGAIEIDLNEGNHRYTVNGKYATGVTTILGVIDKSGPIKFWAVGLMEDFLIKKLVGNIDEDFEPNDVIRKEFGMLALIQSIEEAAEQHTLFLKDAANVGTQAHGWCEEYIKAKLAKKSTKIEMPEDPRVIVAVAAFLDWEKKHKVKFVSSERLVYSKKYGYCGKMDIEAIIDGKLCLVDLKTSNDLRAEVKLQATAYMKADEEERDIKYEGRWAIRLAKETEEEYHMRLNKKDAKKTRKGKKVDSRKAYTAFEAWDLGMETVKNDFQAFQSCMNLYEWIRSN